VLICRSVSRAGIPYETADGVVDFHSLRATYITLLVASGVDPKRVQALARHSTITLTMDRYCKTTSEGSEKHWNGGGRNDGHRPKTGWPRRVGGAKRNPQSSMGLCLRPGGLDQPTDKKIGQEDGSTACDPDPADVDSGA